MLNMQGAPERGANGGSFRGNGVFAGQDSRSSRANERPRLFTNGPENDTRMGGSLSFQTTGGTGVPLRSGSCQNAADSETRCVCSRAAWERRA